MTSSHRGFRQTRTSGWPGEHIHPRIGERFPVISGRLGTRAGGVESTLMPGQEAAGPAGTAHDGRNAGVDQARVLAGLSPLDRRSGLRAGFAGR